MPLEDETFIMHLTSGNQFDINDDIELCDENGDVFNHMDYKDNYYCMNHNK